MAFVNEFISDEDKQRSDWTQFAWSFFSGPHRPWKWTIDRARHVFLIMLTGEGREGGHPAMYALSWQGVPILFSARVDVIGERETGRDVNWKIFDVQLPEALTSQRDEIVATLREAIDAHGWIYDRETVKSVRIEIV